MNIRMKNLFASIVSAAFLACTCTLLSCDDDSFTQSTGQDGRPSAFESAQAGTIGLFYQDNRLAAVKRKDGSSTHFEYQEGRLCSLSLNPPDGVADGHAYSRFRYESDQKIRVERSAEPINQVIVEEIELNENRQIARITLLGHYLPTADGLVLQTTGTSYFLFSYDPTTLNLTAINRFSLPVQQLQASYTFEYDQSPGSMSQVDFPAWLPAYWAYKYSSMPNIVYLQFLNHQNNLTKMTRRTSDSSSPLVIQYDYTYNKADYPITAFPTDNETDRISILY